MQRGDPSNLIRIMPAKGWNSWPQRSRLLHFAIRIITGALREIDMPDTVSSSLTHTVSTGPLPASRKIHVAGVRHPDLRIPLREIDLPPGAGEPPVRAYDSSRPYTDPAVRIDLAPGLPPLRRPWVLARRALEDYEGRTWRPEDDGHRRGDASARGAYPGLSRKPLRAKSGRAVTQLEYARRGIVTPEMEFIAIRENLGRARALEDAGR